MQDPCIAEKSKTAQMPGKHRENTKREEERRTEKSKVMGGKKEGK